MKGNVLKVEIKTWLRVLPQPFFQSPQKGFHLTSITLNGSTRKLPAQRQDIAKIDSVAFLKDSKDSICFKVPLEKLGDKRFTEARWSEVTKDYDLDFAVTQEAKSSSDDDQNSDCNTSIDLDNTSRYDDSEVKYYE